MAEIGDVIQEKYEVLDLLGRGGMSSVYLVMDLKLQKKWAVKEITKLHSAPGRFQMIQSESGVVGIVDYAHTPDALKNVLDTINEIRTHNELLITVAGAGGDRDASKRPEMSEVAVTRSDKLILTSDNPRFEDADDIIRQMKDGVPGAYYNKVLSISDRREAIRTAVAIAKRGDIILVAGKGHENYQEIKGVRHHFDDVEELTNALKEK